MTQWVLAPDLTALADAVAALPRKGPLPTTTVVLPSAALGHAVRRHLIETGRGALLAGARFVPPTALAIELLQLSGADFAPGEEALRPARILSLLRDGIPLEHFPIELLQEAPGWETAFARTIGELEAAGLRPEQLEQIGNAQLADIAAVWRAAEDSAGRSWSTARILLEAAALKPAIGSSLAQVTGHESAALARFLASLSGATLALCAHAPLERRWLDRLSLLFGAPALTLATAPAKPIAGPRELDLLRTGLFAEPAALAAPERPRSTGPDGSVALEEQAGVEEEVQAAADWVAQEVLAGVPLGDIAVLAPRRDPWVALITERLRRMPWPGGQLPVVAPGGLPCAGTAAGARLLALVQALRAFLPIERMPRLLVALRPLEEQRPLSHAAAVGLAGSLGTVGGNAARPEGAREWAARAQARHDALSAWLAQNGDADERERASAQRLVEQLAAALPVLRALDALASLVVARAPLRELAPALGAFCKDHLLQPGEGPPPGALLAAALAPLTRDPACGALQGDDALRLIEEELSALRAPSSRYGQAAVFVGTIREGAGLPFSSVRVVGLCEGALPSAPREDPVLPDSLRRELGVRTGQDSVVAQLHAFRRLVGETRGTLVLSAPRTDADGSQKQPSSVLLDALAVLARTDTADLRALRRAAFRPARAEAEKRLAARPVSTLSTLWHVARSRGALPGSWHAHSSLDLVRARALPASSATEGLVGLKLPLQILPGVTAERSISASSMQSLLGCPHRFLLNKVLGWREPSELPGTGALEPMTYGSLFHDTAQRFYDAHGADFTARKRSLAHWKERAAQIGGAAFDELCGEVPLAGASVKSQQRDRLLRELDHFVEAGWSEQRRFVGAEIAFGSDTPVRLKLPSGALHVSGRIDRLDVEDDHAFVVDLKTGRSKPRAGAESDPTLGIDLQLALYGMVVKQLADELEVPRKVRGAYVYVDRAGERERAFRHDYAALEKAAKAWLDAGLQLLTGRLFPRTPSADDCKWCAFKPVCGPDAPAESQQALLASDDPALKAYLGTRTVAEEEES